jgi:hypothetical protein
MMCTPETTSSTGGCRDAARAVSGAIVDHDDLVSGAAELRNDAPDHVRLVVGGANDPNTEAGGSGLGATSREVQAGGALIIPAEFKHKPFQAQSSSANRTT